MKIVFDTRPLILAGRDTASLYPDEQRQKPAFDAWLDGVAPEDVICVPTVVYAEFLHGMPDDYYTDTRQFLDAFHVVPLSLRIAEEAAALRQRVCGSGQLKAAAKTWGLPVNAFRADFFVLATYLVERANLLVTSDGPLVNLARSVRINAKHVAELMPAPKNGLFENPEPP